MDGSLILWPLFAQIPRVMGADVTVVAPNWGTVGAGAVIAIAGELPTNGGVYLDPGDGVLIGLTTRACEYAWLTDEYCSFYVPESVIDGDYAVVVADGDATAAGEPFTYAQTDVDVGTLDGEVVLDQTNLWSAKSSDAMDTAAGGDWVFVEGTWLLPSGTHGGWLLDVRNEDTNEIMGWGDIRDTPWHLDVGGRYPRVSGQREYCMIATVFDSTHTAVGDETRRCVEDESTCGCATYGATIPSGIAGAMLWVVGVWRRRGVGEGARTSSDRA